MPLVEIEDSSLFEDSNTLLDNKPFFDQPIKHKQEVYEKLVDMSRNNDYTTGDLLDYYKYKFIIKSLAYIYQDKKIQLFLNKLISQED